MNSYELKFAGSLTSPPDRDFIKARHMPRKNPRHLKRVLPAKTSSTLSCSSSLNRTELIHVFVAFQTLEEVVFEVASKQCGHRPIV